MTPRQPSVPNAIVNGSASGGRAGPEQREPLGVVALPLEKVRGACEAEAALLQAVEQDVDARGHGLFPIASQVEEHDPAIVDPLDEARQEPIRGPVGA
jgi:hypothetical protein